MKALVVGLGSMGKRRIRNILHLNEVSGSGIDDIIGFDVSESKRKESEKEYGIRTVSSLEDGLKEKPDAMVISTPPHLHLDYMKAAVREGIPYFVELSILSNDLKEIQAIQNGKEIISAPSFTMRHHESLHKIRQLVSEGNIGKNVTFSYHSGRYLPDWHPWEDYRKSFLGRTDTGGCRELLALELTWLEWVFGNVKSVYANKSKISQLEIESDVYDISFEFENGNSGQMKVDVVTKDPQKWLRVIGEKGNIEWDRKRDAVMLYDGSSKKWEEFKESPGIRAKKPDGTFYSNKEDMYIAEMNDFFNAVKGKQPYPITIQDDVRRLNILDLIEESAKSGSKVYLK